MAKLVYIVGDSGSGKSTSCRNLDPSSTVIINSDQKDLPFKKFKEKFNEEKRNYKKTSNASEIKSLLLKVNDLPHVKIVIIDTFTRIMTDYVMNDKFRAQKGFEKWTHLSGDIYDIINIINDQLRDDIVVYAFCHPETTVTEDGQLLKRIATQGKQLERFVPESFSTIVLYSDIKTIPGKKPEFKFRTVANGKDTCKTPIEMFEEDLIDNDLVLITQKINEYYG